jgi:hypothetical protein
MRNLFIWFTVLAFSYGSFESDFTRGQEGWQADYADYPVGEEVFYELSWGWEADKGMFLSGNNHSDDLFMFVKTKVEDLLPNEEYVVHFELEILTNVPEGLFGVGGSPGESVVVKVGAVSEEPKKVAVDGYYRMNIDKGDQGQEGPQVVIIGNLANPAVDPERPAYESKLMNNSDKPVLVRTDDQGALWLIVGTDSGFEATSKYYIKSIQVHFTLQ